MYRQRGCEKTMHGDICHGLDNKWSHRRSCQEGRRRHEDQSLVDLGRFRPIPCAEREIDWYLRRRHDSQPSTRKLLGRDGSYLDPLVERPSREKLMSLVSAYRSGHRELLELRSIAKLTTLCMVKMRPLRDFVFTRPAVDLL